MKQKENIVLFPTERIVRESPKLEEEALEFIKQQKRKAYAEELIWGLSENILLTLEHNGVNIQSRDFGKDFNFMMEVLRAGIYRQMDLPHHLHDWISKHVAHADEDGLKIDLSEYLKEDELEE